MTPYEYVLRNWLEGRTVADLEVENGWETYTAWRVYQVLKTKEALPIIFATGYEILANNELCRGVATIHISRYLGLLKELETLKEE